MATTEVTTTTEEEYRIPEHERPVLTQLESTLKQMVEMKIPLFAALWRVRNAYECGAAELEHFTSDVGDWEYGENCRLALYPDAP